MAPVGRPTRSKNKVRGKQKYGEIRDREETTIKAMEKTRKEIEKNICKKMEGMMEQIEQIRREWKEKKLAREEERRKDKEEWIEEKNKLEKRLENLEWEREKKDREKRRNNIVIKGVNKWGEINVEQEVRDFIKENLKIEVEIGKVFKLHARGGGCTVMVEVGSREQKREVMVRKRELKKGIYIDDDLTKMERERQNHLRDKAKEERKRK